MNALPNQQDDDVDFDRLRRLKQEIMSRQYTPFANDVLPISVQAGTMGTKLKIMNHVLDAEAVLDSTVFAPVESFVLLRSLDPEHYEGAFRDMVRFSSRGSQFLLRWRNCESHKKRIGFLDTSAADHLMGNPMFFERELEDEVYVLELEQRAKMHLEKLEQLKKDGEAMYAHMTASTRSPTSSAPQMVVATMTRPDPTLSSMSNLQTARNLEGMNHVPGSALASEQQTASRVPPSDRQLVQPPMDLAQALKSAETAVANGWPQTGLSERVTPVAGKSSIESPTHDMGSGHLLPAIAPPRTSRSMAAANPPLGSGHLGLPAQLPRSGLDLHLGKARMQDANRSYGYGDTPPPSQSYTAYSRSFTLAPMSAYNPSAFQDQALRSRPPTPTSTGQTQYRSSSSTGSTYGQFSSYHHGSNFPNLSTGGTNRSQASPHPGQNSGIGSSSLGKQRQSGGLSASHPSQYTPQQSVRSHQQGVSDAKGQTYHSQSQQRHRSSYTPIQQQRSASLEAQSQQEQQQQRFFYSPYAPTSQQEVVVLAPAPVDPTPKPPVTRWHPVPQRPQPQHPRFVLDLLARFDNCDEIDSNPSPGIRSFTDDELARAKLLADPNVLEYRYREYIAHFPLKPGELENSYYMRLLANFSEPEDDDTGERAQAIRYAKKHWANLWEYKDLDYVKKLVREEARKEAEMKERVKVRDPRYLMKDRNGNWISRP
ncbi:hypothetical protein BDV96DRAFT_682157 [Lophiotrema nucula]|uniref:Uncharacterized protein n=1 Tax=Lophiotrema nucula TaxID=690887 RepID=A0A6A5ZR47_9PLEO|nr:hypothetical protein BDV96DRAFT_682157 [Lophiotrema nucula]